MRSTRPDLERVLAEFDAWRAKPRGRLIPDRLWFRNRAGTALKLLVYALFTRMCSGPCIHAARGRRRAAVAFWTLSSKYS